MKRCKDTLHFIFIIKSTKLLRHNKLDSLAHAMFILAWQQMKPNVK